MYKISIREIFFQLGDEKRHFVSHGVLWFIFRSKGNILLQIITNNSYDNFDLV